MSVEVLQRDKINKYFKQHKLSHLFITQPILKKTKYNQLQRNGIQAQVILKKRNLEF